MAVDPRGKAVRSRLHRIAPILAVVFAATLLLPIQGEAAATSVVYRVDDLGTLPGDSSSFARGINASGEVVGGSMGPTGTHAFKFQDGSGMVKLAAPPGRPITYAHAINDAGNVAGTAQIGGTDLGHAVRWTNGVPKDLGTLGTGSYSEGESINASGAVVGYSYMEGGAFNKIHGFRYTDAAGLVDVTPTSDSARVRGINTSGQIAGWREYRAFRLSSGVFTDLGVPTGFGFSFGYAINGSGQVAGHVTSASGNSEKIFRYTDGAGMVILGGVGEHNAAFGINSGGDVVGEGLTPESTGTLHGWRALLYTDAAGLVDLNTLIDPASGWVLLGASGINDAGQISGRAFNNKTQRTTAVRLTPIGALPIPAAPTGLTATAFAAWGINLKWNDNSTFESGFRLERRTGTNPFALIDSTGPNAVSFLEADLAAGTTYDYRIAAFNTSGQSAYSNIASATTWSSTADTAPPSVQFVTPANGATVTSIVAVKITASDDVAISGITFRVDGVTKCQTTSSVLTCNWNTRKLTAGSHTLTALAVDSSENASTQTISVKK
jgi:probable HAF family extracellular repeat protein